MEDREALLAEIQALKLHNQAIARELRVTRAKDQQLTRTMDKLYKRVSSNAIQLQKPSDREGFDGISFIIAAYNIPDQLRRTLTTLTPHYQNCRPDQIEI